MVLRGVRKSKTYDVRKVGVSEAVGPLRITERGLTKFISKGGK